MEYFELASYAALLLVLSKVADFGLFFRNSKSSPSIFLTISDVSLRRSNSTLVDFILIGIFKLLLVNLVNHR